MPLETARFRSPVQMWVLLGAGAFLAFVWGSQAFRSSVAPDTGRKLAFLLLAAGTFGFTWWVALRPVVVMGASGIVIRNLFSTRRLGWQEIARFRIGRWKLLSAVCVIELKDGTSTHAYAIQVPNVSRGRPVTRESRIIDALNARLAKSDAESPTASNRAR
jgi:Bacterial PH domain